MPTAHVPGSVKLTDAAREVRTGRYRTWRSPHPDMAWCAECLLCGDWRSGYASRETAAGYMTGAHAGSCHVLNGCHCPQPHLTAALAARIGVKDEFPGELSGQLFARACGVRLYLPPAGDMNGVPSGGPAFGSGGYRWRKRDDG